MRVIKTIGALFLFGSASMAMANTDKNLATSLRIATFNVSMEALNYVDYQSNETPMASGEELKKALSTNHLQIRNIAEIIQKVNPDIILLNEFDHLNDNHQTLKHFINNYLSISQNDNTPVNYPYFYQGPVNTGVLSEHDLNGDSIKKSAPADAYGFGYFPGHFAMALLSKYPINTDDIRTFQYFKWKDMPNALMPIDPETNRPWYSNKTWSDFRLSSKSHWDIPVNINGKTLHVLASHPTPPVFDGPEDRNGKRNHDELRFWVDYLTPSAANYIYDDNNSFGGLAHDKAFVLLGDLNASSVDGNAIPTAIKRLTSHPRVNDPLPKSSGAKVHTPENAHAANHTAFWRMRADYVLPSKTQLTTVNSGVFWPENHHKDFRLIKDRAASSDHRLVWVDVIFKQ